MKWFVGIILSIYLSAGFAQTLNLSSSWMAMPAKSPTLFTASKVVDGRPINSINIFVLDGKKQGVINLHKRLRSKKLGVTSNGYKIISIKKLKGDLFQLEASSVRTNSTTFQIWKFRDSVAFSARIKSYQDLSSSERNKLLSYMRAL